MPTERVPTDRETKCLFAFAPASAMNDNVPVLTFLIPNKGWEYMQGGLGHDFDLTNVGIPLKIIIGRCDNHAHGMAILERANGGDLKRFTDIRDADVSFDDKPKQS